MSRVKHLNPPAQCDHCREFIGEEFIDGRLYNCSQWANLCPKCWDLIGVKRLGTGYGQRYRAGEDGEYWKVEG